MKKILVINANPKSDSMCKSIAQQYSHVAGSKHELKQVDIGDMEFEINLMEGFNEVLPLEDDLLNFQDMVRWSEHIVIVSPVWWGTIPAKFKGVIDRAFLPGFAFKYIDGKEIVKSCLDRGLIINCTRDTILRFLPPINVKKEDIDECFDILGSIFKEGL